MYDRRYAMNVAVREMAFWREPKNTWQKIGSLTPGVDMMFCGPHDADVSKQIEELELLISQGVSGLVVFSNDHKAVTPTINRAVDEGIPVITAFADAPESKRLAHIGTNQSGMAETIARRVMRDFRDRLQKKPRYLVAIGANSSEDQAERLKGVQKATAGQMECVACVQDEFSSTVAEQKILDAWENAQGKIDFIFGCNSQSAIGAVAALKKLGKQPGEVVVTGWDAEMEVMREIKGENGHWVHATTVLYSSYMVQVCFAMLEAATFGYLYSDTLNAKELGLPAVPETLEIPMKQVVTRANVAEYLGKA
jgi:ABC-type sugar transport system substrate-binding protein